MAYTWSADLETGNATIDSQHKELISAINKLLDACSAGQGRTQIAETSNFLVEYTKRHFGDEERLQRDSKYPDYATHKTYHDGFVKVVAKLVQDLNHEGPTIVMVGKINSTIAQWLLNHIKREDTKVAAHIKQQKAL